MSTSLSLVHRLAPENPLTCEILEGICQQEPPRLVLSAGNIGPGHASYKQHLNHGTPIYGTTTGFGPHVVSEGAQGDTQGAHLVAHLAAGFGREAPASVVRGAMVLRLHTIGRGYSGVSAEVASLYCDMLTAGIVPCVPESGSVGASGDLVPLAHIVRALMGEGDVTVHGRRVPAADALKMVNLAPLSLNGRDALALVNGTSFLTAYTGLAVARTYRMVTYTETIIGWLYRVLGCRENALAPHLHKLRGHAEQIQSASLIRAEAERFGPYEDSTRPLQEVYSLRCAPQILGACRQNAHFTRTTVEAEMNGIDDNPIFTHDMVLHGGNFHGQAVGFAADALNAALTQVAVLAERLIALLCTPSRHNDFAPLLLAFEPGRDSGLAGAQLTATALLAEMRGSCQHYATSSIPTNADNQDVVPMATLAAQSAYRQTERLSAVLAVLYIAACQLNFLRTNGKSAGRTSPAPKDFPEFEPLESDRALQSDIGRIAGLFLHGFEATSPTETG